jgi:hypothetical protein
MFHWEVWGQRAREWHLCTLNYWDARYVCRPPRPIASVDYPEASESQIRRIAQRRLLVRFHNKYLNQLVCGVQESSASNRKGL